MDFEFSARSAQLQRELLAFWDSHVYPAGSCTRASSPPRGTRTASRRSWRSSRPPPGPGACGTCSCPARPGAPGLDDTTTRRWPRSSAGPRRPGGAELLRPGHRQHGAAGCCSAPRPSSMNGWCRCSRATIRSCFAMTEPAVCPARTPATSPPLSPATATRWCSTAGSGGPPGLPNKDCKLMIFMGCTDPEAAPHQRQSMVLVPTDTPGIAVLRNLPVFGYTDRLGHGEVQLTECGSRGEPARRGGRRLRHGPGAARPRPGPPRMWRSGGRAGARAHVPPGHRGWRSGAHWRSRAWSRSGSPERASGSTGPLLVLNAAWLMDTRGQQGGPDRDGRDQGGRPDGPRVIDRAMQAPGAPGVGQDTPLARMYTGVRALRIADGPDEVHLRSVARRELAKYRA